MLFFEDAEPLINAAGQKYRIFIPKAPLELLADIRIIINYKYFIHVLLLGYNYLKFMRKQN